MNIIVMGLPGSGKSTQGKILAEKLKVPAISTGVIFRAIEKQETELGRKIKNVIDTGGLIDDETTYEAVDKYLEILRNGFVIDGFPRTIGQAKRELLPVDKVIYLKLTDQEATRRILLRKERPDDTLEVVTHRLEVYHQLTEPILDYYRQQGKLVEINGEETIENVERLIDKALGVTLND